MKMYGGGNVYAHVSLTVASFMPQQTYALGTPYIHQITGWVCPTTGMDVMGK
jgi:hypothetical protein